MVWNRATMALSDMESGRFRFGLFEFDVSTRELRREGMLVRLQSQPARVLGCLIERAGQVVSREQLRGALWGSETFVDFDRALNFCMSQVRSALKDDSAQPTYIRTIPKHGYQFIAPLEPISEPAAPARSGAHARGVVLVLVIGVLAGLLFLTAYWARSRQTADQRPIVAVVRFDNETGDPAVTRFSDGLTDNVVEQLTSLSNGRYVVIGNAKILRQPRDQRDLKSIASSLHAAYAVLGQVQSNGAQLRILAHLIRLPDETHIWVARMDRALVDPLSLESETAHKIAVEFWTRVSAEPTRAGSLPSANH
jgi:DNA-binding winged helix-turn-helix (wHTH) protein/TolB-like protein